MGTWYEDPKLQGKFFSIKKGEKKSFTIAEVKRVEGCNPKYAMKDKAGTSLGYNYELITDEGKILTISSFSFLKALKDYKADTGSCIEVDHPENGVWNIKEGVPEIPF